MSLDLIQKQLESLDAKLDKLSDVQVDIRIDLAEHMRRTELAERRLEIVESELRPVVEHVHSLQTSMKVILKIAAIISSAVGVVFAGIKLYLDWFK